MIFDTEEQLINYYRNLELPLCSCVIYRMDENGNQVDQGGVTLERQVPGFRTESVTGRDAMEADIEELTYPHLDGAKYRSKKKQSRDITISYKLVSTTPEIHRKKLIKLRSILFGSELEYSSYRFRDEKDVYYLGTVKSFTEAKFVRNFASEGEITIHCSDPFKYSVELFEQTATLNSKGQFEFKIDYNGTYPSSPKFIATHKQKTGSMFGENGYVAFSDEKSHIVQAGDPAALDGAFVRKEVETLITEDFGKNDIWRKGGGWYSNLFAAPTNNNSKPIYYDGELYSYKTAFTRTGNSKMPDGSGVWLKSTKSTTNDKWHGPSAFKGFTSSTPVKMVNVIADYAFAKQSNGSENMMAGYEFILFGVDPARSSQPNYYGWNTSKVNNTQAKKWAKPTINGVTYQAWPVVRIAIWNTSPNDTTAMAWIQANNGKVNVSNIKFDCKMPLTLKSKKPGKNGWIEWTPGHWSYWKDGKWLKGWQKLKDSKGTFWFYFDKNGYMLTGVHKLKWSKGEAHFHFNNDGEMSANTSVRCVIDGVEGNYQFDVNGCYVLDVADRAGWKGSGYLWRYYKNVSGTLKYLTGWQKINNKWYYFTANGYTVHGWQKLKWNGKEATYYFNSSCQMVTGTHVINGVSYTFNSSGALTSGQKVKVTKSATTTTAANKSNPTDVYYKMSISSLTIQVLNGELKVTLNGKTYKYANAVPTSVIFTGFGFQEYVFKNCKPFSYTQAKINAGDPIGVMYLDKLDIKKLDYPWEDSKNAFPGGSTVTIDCGTGDIYLNNAKKPALGALGNDYETLKLVPNLPGQRILCSNSKWVPDGTTKDERGNPLEDERPEFKIQYREVFI